MASEAPAGQSGTGTPEKDKIRKRTEIQHHCAAVQDSGEISGADGTVGKTADVSELGAGALGWKRKGFSVKRSAGAHGS